MFTAIWLERENFENFISTELLIKLFPLYVLPCLAAVLFYSIFLSLSISAVA